MSDVSDIHGHGWWCWWAIGLSEDQLPSIMYWC